MSNERIAEQVLNKHLREDEVVQWEGVTAPFALLEKDAVSKEAYEEAQTNLASVKADIDLMKENIAQTELRAPFDGIIGLRQVSEGAYANTGTVVATLTKITPLKIEFAVPERYASAIKPGMNLTFNVEGRLDNLYGRIYATESKVDRTTHTLPVRALYANSRGELLPGRFTNIHLKTQEIPDAVAITKDNALTDLVVKDNELIIKSIFFNLLIYSMLLISEIKNLPTSHIYLAVAL